MTPRGLNPARAALVRDLAPGNLFQPATALWRVYEIEALRQHVRFAGRVLDVGCGDGSLGRVVLGNGPCEVVGVEPDPGDAADARSSGFYRRVYTATGDRIPEPDRAFDLSFSNSVLEHIPEVEPVLAEVARVLRAGGRFVFTVPSEQFHACLAGAGWLERMLARRDESLADRIDRRLRHYRYWSPEQWRAALASAGLRLVETHRYFPAAAVRAWERISSWTGGIAFELAGRRSETRPLQRGLGLHRLDSLFPAAARTAVLERVLHTHLHAPAEVKEGASGGLLVVAERG